MWGVVRSRMGRHGILLPMLALAGCGGGGGGCFGQGVTIAVADDGMDPAHPEAATNAGSGAKSHPCRPRPPE
ncbi:MAG: hypothetical protein F4Y85_10295 [Gammaproteobacteria bacterium]|nr:hypothetical protein [Gammaproteobacteria bacterium]